MGVFPWTQWVFQQVPSLPVAILFGIAITIFLIGIELYRTSSDFSITDVLNLIPKATVEVEKRINKGKIVGTLLITIGLFAALTIADEAVIVSANASPGGGPSLYQCVDFPSLACWTSGSNSGTKVTLGTWLNMPSSTTELMGNASYRGLLIDRAATGEAGISVGLQVGCINPSNTPGAGLTLQYANYSDTTHLNTTNFVNIGTEIPIDNSANEPCPGTLEANAGTLPSINANPVIFMFRVVGSGGGGSGDNPRLSYVSVYVLQNVEKVFTAVTLAPTTTTFKFVAYATYPLIVATTVTVNYIATNETSTACGSATNIDQCVQRGTATCSIPAGGTACPTTTVTFAVAFTGTVSALAQPTNGGNLFNVPIGTISLLQAQTLTV